MDFVSVVAIPRQNIVHDIFGFVQCGLTTPRLIEECPELLSLRPATQEIQVASIRAIPMYRYEKPFEYSRTLLTRTWLTQTAS